jgi:DNA mismatch repair protein MutS2
MMSAATADATAAAERESFQLLEWPALCRQVACFAQTPMGAELAAKCALPVGRSQEESEQLLQQTAEAQAAMLK